MALNEKGKQSLKKIGIVVCIIAALFIGYRFMHTARNVGESQKIAGFQLSTAADVTTGKTVDQAEPLPSSKTANTGTQIKWQVFTWNSQMPLMFANGGVTTTEGSLFAKNGINCTIVRQDDCNKTITDFIENAKEIASNPNTVPMIASFMGDGMPGFSVSLAKLQESKIDAIIFYFMGRSDGEDCFWGPKEWKANPKACLGSAVAGVERDGDINIVLKWAADNNIPINADTKTIDSQALNIVPCTDFNTDLKTKMLPSYTETRMLKKDGKTVPGSTVKVHPAAFTTWSPVDGELIEQYGGFARLASTKEYTSQMPNAAIISKQWAYAHMNEMQSIVKALGQAGDQVRSFPEALKFAAKVSADVYGDKDHDANFWLKYYHGIETKGPDGTRVFVGGSKAYNLADAANMCGLGKDGIDRYKITYETFGNILAKLYPEQMNGWIPYKQIMDKTFISSVLANNSDLKNEESEIDQQEKELATGDITDEMSSKPYNIQFATGSAVISPKSKADLVEIFKSKVVSGGLRIGIYGHTDNTGSDEINEPLSLERAEAVSTYLQSIGIKKVYIVTKGYGSKSPITDAQGNHLDPSDPRNKCVEIVQGK